MAPFIKLRYLMRMGLNKRDLCLELKVSLDRLNALLENSIHNTNKTFDSKIDRKVKEIAMEKELAREYEIYDKEKSGVNDHIKNYDDEDLKDCKAPTKHRSGVNASKRSSGSKNNIY